MKSDLRPRKENVAVKRRGRKKKRATQPFEPVYQDEKEEEEEEEQETRDPREVYVENIGPEMDENVSETGSSNDEVSCSDHDVSSNDENCDYVAETDEYKLQGNNEQEEHADEEYTDEWEDEEVEEEEDEELDEDDAEDEVGTSSLDDNSEASDSNSSGQFSQMQNLVRKRNVAPERQNRQHSDDDDS